LAGKEYDCWLVTVEAVAMANRKSCLRAMRYCALSSQRIASVDIVEPETVGAVDRFARLSSTSLTIWVLVNVPAIYPPYFFLPFFFLPATSHHLLYTEPALVPTRVPMFVAVVRVMYARFVVAAAATTVMTPMVASVPVPVMAPTTSTGYLKEYLFLKINSLARLRLLI